MGRPRKEIDEEEIEEIIDLTLKDLGGLKSKLTYNNVWNFNKKLLNYKVKRKNGKEFKLYGYTFWASNYNGVDYYGKSKIDEVKTKNNVILAGESFNPDVQDLLLLIDKYKNKPSELSKRIIKIFERDRNKITVLKKENIKLTNEIIKLKDIQESFELGFTTLFYNSMFTDNSLNDVMSLKMTGDEYVKTELKNMFNNDEDRLNKVLNSNPQSDKLKSSVVGFHDKAKAKEELKELFKRK